MKKLLSMLLATGMVLSLAACGGTGSSEPAATTDEGGDAAATTEAAVADEDLDYEYGEHFWSDEPVTYTMMFNDNPAYPMKETWQTEGIFKAIKDATNVDLDLTIVHLLRRLSVHHPQDLQRNGLRHRRRHRCCL